ncbi:MAG: homoserine O-acetyltransferase [Planctomycetota bacterium]
MSNGSIGLVQTETRALDLPPSGFKLERGGVLPAVSVAFERYGELAPDRGNAILICHALSGDAHAAGYHADEDRKPGWWDNMIGPGQGIDTGRFHVIATNILGGCKGTTGPSSTNPATGRPFGSDFPEITIGDMVAVQKLLLETLGIDRLHAVIGGSTGGLQVLEWAVRYPGAVANAICIASAESLSAQALAFDIVARKIIMADPSWRGGHYYGAEIPEKGLSLARMIGHITYLSRESMDRKFGRERREGMDAGPFGTDFQIESYLNHQGLSFVDRFDANSFLYITQAMSGFSLAERGPSIEAVLAGIRARVMVLAVSSDWLYPAEQSRALAAAFLRAGRAVTYAELDAPYGHDSFLLPSDDLTRLISSFLTCHGPSAAAEPAVTREADVIAGMIPIGSRVLDLGCGDGALLARLARRDGVTGHGIDIAHAGIVACNRRGVPVFQADLDQGLGLIPDGAYDYAVLSATLLETRKPHLVLNEMLRVARAGIVTFPNFAHWRHRARLSLGGRLPMSGGLPHRWYDTPNLRFPDPGGKWVGAFSHQARV